MATDSTRESILDAAETLFARDGFHGASIRAITTEADVSLASVNYHFGSKDALLRAIFERRFIPLNNMRIERLDQVLQSAQASSSPPNLTDILRAFIEPVFSAFESLSVLCNVSSIIAISMNRQDESVSALMQELMMPVFKRFLAAFKMALPQKSEEELFIKMHFMIGSVIHMHHVEFIAGKQRKAPRKGPKSPLQSVDRTVMRERLIAFVDAGMRS